MVLGVWGLGFSCGFSALGFTVSILELRVLALHGGLAQQRNNKDPIPGEEFFDSVGPGDLHWGLSDSYWGLVGHKDYRVM